MGSNAIVIEFESDDDTFANIEIDTLTEGGDVAVKNIAENTENLVSLIDSDDSTVSTLNEVITLKALALQLKRRKHGLRKERRKLTIGTSWLNTALSLANEDF